MTVYPLTFTESTLPLSFIQPVGGQYTGPGYPFLPTVLRASGAVTDLLPDPVTYLPDGRYMTFLQDTADHVDQSAAGSGQQNGIRLDLHGQEAIPPEEVPTSIGVRMYVRPRFPTMWAGPWVPMWLRFYNGPNPISNNQHRIRTATVRLHSPNNTWGWLFWTDVISSTNPMAYTWDNSNVYGGTLGDIFGTYSTPEKDAAPEFRSSALNVQLHSASLGKNDTDPAGTMYPTGIALRYNIDVDVLQFFLTTGPSITGMQDQRRSFWRPRPAW